MRKDLKIGMAIGAVLLAVVIVYFAMPKPEDGELAGAGGVVDVNAGGEAGDPDAGQADAAPLDEGGLDGGGADAEPLSPAPVAATGGTPDDPFAPGAEGSDPADAAEEVAAAGDEGGTNWTKLLATGRAEIVRTETPSVADRPGGGATAVPAAGDAAPGDPSGATEAASAAAGGQTVGDAADSSPVERESDAAATPPGQNGTASTVRIPAGQDAAGSAARTHVMQQDETFTSIAKMLYGDGRHYLAIQKANPDLDPTRIRPGTIINLPDPATIKGDRAAGNDSGAATAEARRALDPKTEYEVKANDSLHKIATRVYGTSTMWEKIYELNQEAIGSDPARLKLGMVLKLPPAAEGAESVSR